MTERKYKRFEVHWYEPNPAHAFNPGEPEMVKKICTSPIFKTGLFWDKRFALEDLENQVTLQCGVEFSSVEHTLREFDVELPPCQSGE